MLSYLLSSLSVLLQLINEFTRWCYMCGQCCKRMSLLKICLKNMLIPVFLRQICLFTILMIKVVQKASVRKFVSWFEKCGQNKIFWSSFCICSHHWKGMPLEVNSSCTDNELTCWMPILLKYFCSFGQRNLICSDVSIHRPLFTDIIIFCLLFHWISTPYSSCLVPLTRLVVID